MPSHSLKTWGDADEADVSPENDGTLKREENDGFGGPWRKEWIDEAVTILRRADRLCHPASREWDPGRRPLPAARHQRSHLLHLEKKYAHLGVSELRRLRQVEEENARLKRLVADLSLDKHMLSEALRKNV